MIKLMRYCQQLARCCFPASVGVTGVYIVWFNTVLFGRFALLYSISRVEVRGKSDIYSRRLHQRLTVKLQYSPSSCHLESESISQWDFKPAFSHWVTGAGLNDGLTELFWIPSQKESKWDAKGTSSLGSPKRSDPFLFSNDRNATAASAGVSGTRRASFRI